MNNKELNMQEILLIASIVCFQINALGMTSNPGSQCLDWNFKNIAQTKQYTEIKGNNRTEVVSNQNTISKSWNNLVEALKIMGLLGDSTPPEPKFTQRPKKEENKLILPKNPEWDKYINWDPEETVSSCPKTTSLPSVMPDKSSNSSQKIRWHNNFKKKRAYYKCAASPYSYFYSYPFPPLEKVCFHKRFSKTPYKVKCIERLNRMNKSKKTFTKYLYIHECSISNGTANQDLTFGITHGIIQKNSQNAEEYTFVNHKLDLFTREITKFNF